MKTIILGGYSHKNKDWAYEVKKNIPNSQVYEWKHWSDINIKFSEKEEAENIKEEVGMRAGAGLPAQAGETEVNIIAKSIGTVVAAMLLKDIKFRKIVFCGIPINDINEDERREYRVLSDFKAENLIVFQNSDDEHGSFEKVREFLSQINPNIKIVEKPGSSHDYPYFEEFKTFLLD